MFGINGREKRKDYIADREINSMTLQEREKNSNRSCIIFKTWKRLLLRCLVGSWQSFSMISLCFKAIIHLASMVVLLSLIIGIMSPILIIMISGYVLSCVLCAIHNFFLTTKS